MGNGNSKKKYGPILAQEKTESIRSLLETVNANLKGITPSNLEAIWHGKLSDGLKNLFLTYLFRKTKVITHEEFESFYYNMVEAGLEDRARTLITVLGIDNNIPPKNFQTYVSELIESYMIIMQSKYPDAYGSWKTGDLTQKADVNAISYFFIKDINYCDDGMVPISELENWLHRSPFLKEISDSVMKFAFGVELAHLRPRLPKADKMSTLLRIPTVIVLSHLTRQESKTWRLLYSSSIDSHSWQIFQSRLFREGPTVVLIQDRGGPLLGGYASNSWKITPNFYGDENCFIFRLRPELLICNPTGYNQNYQYLNSGASTLPNGLGMGGQLNYFGFFLSSEFGPGSVSKTCTTFRDYVPLASQAEFSFSQLEVWAIGEPDPIEEGVRQVGPASGLAMHRADPGTMAVLELAGKSGYAKAAGELQEEEAS